MENAEIARFKVYKNKNSIIHEAFITSDPGHKKHQETRELGQTRRSKERSQKEQKDIFLIQRAYTHSPESHPSHKIVCSDNSKHP
ncbi:MAG: hypothetical protein QW292_14455 [Candidatus Parvarchaeota archaeon]